jgi:peptidoglycan/xylan/chitin deacetylase (PgdA/CDA1 family)
MSGLYVSNRLTSPEQETDTPRIVENSFNGTIPSEIVRGDTSKNQVIFTFDAGSGNASVEKILAALEKHQVKGTFFMTGIWALRNPEAARMIAAKGHEIFNHTYNHPKLTELIDATITQELINTDSALELILATSTKPYFRPPYGDRDARVLATAAKAGYRSVYWTIDAGDWMESEGMSADEVAYRILTNIEPGNIFLMHVGDTLTGEILDRVFSAIEQRGYKIVALTQGL